MNTPFLPTSQRAPVDRQGNLHGVQAIKGLRGKRLLCWSIQDGAEDVPFYPARVRQEVVNR
jgi:hypothetical protein